ncbi:MAG TPA: hypothetical protein VJ951_14900, partial [Bacteroidales bacterium]|nr:hypothetical protein [Bacteroidales bacterium]
TDPKSTPTTLVETGHRQGGIVTRPVSFPTILSHFQYSLSHSIHPCIIQIPRSHYNNHVSFPNPVSFYYPVLTHKDNIPSI